MFLLWSECDSGFGFWRFFVLLWYGHFQKIFKLILRVMLWLAQKPFNVCISLNLYVGYSLSPLWMINFIKCLSYIWRFLKLKKKKKLTVWRVDPFFFLLEWIDSRFQCGSYNTLFDVQYAFFGKNVVVLGGCHSSLLGVLKSVINSS